MLIDDFFTLKSIEYTNDIIHAQICLNENHRIFEGHFPGKPVVPGVCLIQSIKEIIEKHLDKTFLLSSSSIIKFLIPVIPQNYPIINIKIRFSFQPENRIKTDAQIYFENSVFVKFKGDFLEV